MYDLAHSPWLLEGSYFLLLVLIEICASAVVICRQKKRMIDIAFESRVWQSGKQNQTHKGCETKKTP